VIFLADESVDQPIVASLRSLGHDVLAVAEMEPGIADDEVLDRANAAGAILVTADTDFGELIFRLGRASHGVLLLRLAGLSAKGKSNAVGAAVVRHESELPGAFTVISSGTVRVRRPPP
jgi:predicted nuclease of predicted toxin-antitoxin system